MATREQLVHSAVKAIKARAIRFSLQAPAQAINPVSPTPNGLVGTGVVKPEMNGLLALLQNKTA